MPLNSELNLPWKLKPTSTLVHVTLNKSMMNSCLQRFKSAKALKQIAKRFGN